MYFQNTKESKTIRNRQSGFTLVELLIVMLIGSILTIGVVSVFVQQTRAMALNEDLVDLEQNLRIAMDMLHRDVRMAGAHLDKENMPVFKLGTIYYNSAASLMVPLSSDGGAGSPPPSDAIQMRYSPTPGLNIKIYSGSAANFSVCRPSGLSVGQRIEISYSAKNGGVVYPVNGYIEITQIANITCNGVGCPGDECDKPNFSPGPSEWNPPGGLEDYDASGTVWDKIETLTYFVEPDYVEDGNSFGPALMRTRGLEAPAVVAFGVNNLQIIYRDVDGNPTTTLADIHAVEIELSGETRNEHKIGGAEGKRSRAMKTEVVVRNLAF